MQEGVAVDDIVAATTDNRVVACATQDDVAGIERYQTWGEETRQADDEIGIVELVFRGQQPGGVGSLQDVVEG